ncbi:MAG TPA: hypothetical protein VJ761_01545 [Ktedonobacteraceae bacterium]|nr:hypothetical protein [Ktedonobacteraceae bacterium]
MRLYFMFVWVIMFLFCGTLTAGLIYGAVYLWHFSSGIATVDSPYTCDSLNYDSYWSGCVDGNGNVVSLGEPASGSHKEDQWPSYWQPLAIACAVLVGIFVGAAMGFYQQFNEQHRLGWEYHERNIHISMGEDQIDINERGER